MRLWERCCESNGRWPHTLPANDESSLRPLDATLASGDVGVDEESAGCPERDVSGQREARHTE